MVLNAEDQAFLTNLTLYFERGTDGGVWIGLQDLVKEGVFRWINGEKVQPDLEYWQPSEPNNVIAEWDDANSGQDCVGIVPPTEVGAENWLFSWDDIICGGKRHYICETKVLNLK